MRSRFLGVMGSDYPSLDDQILACIEAAKLTDKRTELSDFQLRIAANDLVLFNLKTNQSYILYDTDNEPLDQQPEPSASLAEKPRTPKPIASSPAAMATLLAYRLVGRFAELQASVTPRAR